MRESCLYGSVRGASGDWRPYRDNQKGGQPMKKMYLRHERAQF